MQALVNELLPPLVIATIILFVASGIIWLFWNHGINKLKNPEEWKDAGSSGEQIIYLYLRDKVHIPENQIFRNVYIPTKNGKTSEIDILVLSKKGLLVFECKNYSGNIYGDRKRNKWIQYVGNKKSYFYNPFLQNGGHVKSLRNYLKSYGDIPIIPFVATISGGQWKVKNLNSDDYLLGYNCHLEDIYAALSDSELIAMHFNAISRVLRPLSRPGEEVKEKHIEQIHHGNV